jgi:hypothetical protein
MGKMVGRWLLYEHKDGEFVLLSKPLKTKKEAEEKREKLRARSGRKHSEIGVGFIRSPWKK